MRINGPRLVEQAVREVDGLIGLFLQRDVLLIGTQREAKVCSASHSLPARNTSSSDFNVEKNRHTRRPIEQTPRSVKVPMAMMKR